MQTRKSSCWGTAFVAELRKNGLLVTEVCEDGIDCVVVAYDSELNYAKLTEVCKVLFTQDVPFYGTNPDLRLPSTSALSPIAEAIGHDHRHHRQQPHLSWASPAKRS